MPHYLLIANKTLVGPEVRAAVLERASADAVFHVVVPDAEAGSADDVDFILPSAGSGSAAFPAQVGDSISRSGQGSPRRAQHRLHDFTAIVREAGAKVHGTIGPSDPMDAIREILSDADIDEILLSTLPSGVSRWVRMDLPSRVQRAFDGPVTVITAQPPSSH